MPVYNKQLTKLNFNRNFRVGSSTWNSFESYTTNVPATRLWIRESGGVFRDFANYNSAQPTHTGATYLSTKGPNWRFPIQGLRPEYASATVPTRITLDDVRNFYPGYDQESTYETIISGWIKVDRYNAGGGSSGSSILEISTASTKATIAESNSYLSVFIDSSGDFTIRFGDGTDWVKVTAQNNKLPPTGQWFNFVVVVPDSTTSTGEGEISQADLASTKIYIDGRYTGTPTVAAKNSADLTVPSSGTYYAYIGYGMGEDNLSSMEGPVDFDGEIAEIAIHKHSGFGSYSDIDIRKIFYRGAIQGVNQLASGVTNINPYVRRAEDQNRDYNPTILSGMDSRRRGNTPSIFNDTQVPQVSGSTLSYPTKLFNSDPLLNTIYSGQFVKLDIEVPTTRSFNEVADFKIYEDYFDRDEQPALDPFVESRIYSPGTGSKGDFFTTGSLNLAGAVSSSFSKPLTEKTAIVIDLNPATPSTFGFTDLMENTYTSPTTYAGGSFNVYAGAAPSSAATGSLMMYWNDTYKRFDTIGEIISFKEAGLVSATTYNTLAKVNDYLEEKTCVGFSRSSAIAAMLLSSSNGGGKVVSRGGTGVYEVPGGDTAQYTGTARPISTFGFPFASKYQAPADNLVSMKNYIDKPFLLEKIVYRFSGSFQCGTNDGNNTSTYGLGHAVGGITPSNGRSTQSINVQTSIQHYSFFLARQFETIDRGPTTISRDAFSKSGSSLVVDNDSDMAGGLLQHYTASTTTRELIGYGQVFLAFETNNSDYFDQTTFDYLKNNGMGREVSIFVEHKNQVTGSYQMEFLPTKTPIYDTSVPVRIPISDASATDGKDETITFQSFLGGRGLPFEDETRDFAKNIIGQTPAISSVFGAGAGTSDDLLEVKVNDVTPVHSPYVLMPEDKLIFGWSAPLELEDGFTGLGSHPNTFTASPGVGEIVFYGSYLQDEKPKANYLNQSPQFTQAVSRDYFEEIHDQFDTEVVGSFTGSYVDDVMSGSVAPAFTEDLFRTYTSLIDSKNIVGSDVSAAVYPGQTGDPLARSVGSRQTEGTVGDQGTLRRVIRHLFEGEYEEHSVPKRYSDLALMSEGAVTQQRVNEAGGLLNYVANLVGGYQKATDDEVASFNLPVGSYFGFQSWPFAFPFERKFRRVQKSFSPIDRKSINYVIYRPEFSKTTNFGTVTGRGWNDLVQISSVEYTRLQMSGSNFTDYRDESGDGQYGVADLALGTSGIMPIIATITGSVPEKGYHSFVLDGFSLGTYYNDSSQWGDITTRSAIKILHGIGGANRGRHIATKVFKSSTTNNDSTGNQDSINANIILDHPRGTKYGYSNLFPTPSTIVFRRDRFGQFRDMLEQSLNTHSINVGFNVIRQQAVTARFCDLENPSQNADPYLTHRGNKDIYSRTSYPFLDQDPVEDTDTFTGTPVSDTLLSPSENLNDYMVLNRKNNTTIISAAAQDFIDDGNSFLS